VNVHSVVSSILWPLGGVCDDGTGSSSTPDEVVNILLSACLKSITVGGPQQLLHPSGPLLLQ